MCYAPLTGKIQLGQSRPSFMHGCYRTDLILSRQSGVKCD